MCSSKGWHRPRWSKCPFSAFGLAPNDCCKLTSECFNALMGANRKLRMVITQITCPLLLLPPLYGPSSALKTDVPLHSTVKIRLSGGVLLWRLPLQVIEYWKDGSCFVHFGPPVLCIMLCWKFKDWAPIQRLAGTGRLAVMAETTGKMGEIFYSLCMCSVYLCLLCLKMMSMHNLHHVWHCEALIRFSKIKTFIISHILTIQFHFRSHQKDRL